MWREGPPQGQALSLVPTAAEAEGRLPFPDPQLSFAEMAELAQCPGPAGKRLAELLAAVIKPPEPAKKRSARNGQAEGLRLVRHLRRRGRWPENYGQESSTQSYPYPRETLGAPLAVSAAAFRPSDGVIGHTPSGGRSAISLDRSH